MPWLALCRRTTPSCSMLVTAQPAALMASAVCSAFRVVSKLVLVCSIVIPFISKKSKLLGGRRGRGRRFCLTRIEALLVQLVAILLGDLFQLDPALRGERLARLHDVQYIEALIRLQDFLPGRIQLGILAFAARQGAALRRHFAVEARTLRFDLLARGGQLLAGLAVLRQAGRCLLRGGGAALLLLAQFFPLRALLRQLRLAAGQLLFQDRK